MTRYEIINSLIKSYNFKNYLEIGYQNGICYNNIDIEYKNAVDPYPNVKNDPTLLIMTSDDFFQINKNKYDIIFIDGLHTYEQVKKDFENSLKSISNNGVIVFHDMSPSDVYYNGMTISGEERSKSFNEGGQWNGDCYKLAIDMYNGEYEYFYETVDSDQGCLILYVNKTREFKKHNIDHEYNSLDRNRKDILNLISVEDFKNNN